MAELKLPDLGEHIEGGDVVAVRVQEGDTIAVEQTVIEIETEKAVLEVPSTMAGRVSKVNVKAGDHLKVGGTILEVESEAGEGAKPAKAKPAEEPAAEAKKPAAAESEEPAEPEPPATAEAKPSKAVPETPPTPPVSEPPAATAPPSGPTVGEPVPAGPATRRLARELGVDLHAAAAAFPNQRLTEELVKQFVRQRSSTASSAGGVAISSDAARLPDFTKWGPVDSVPLSKLQRITAEHLHAGWIVAPHVTQFDEADVTELEKLRQRYRDTERGKQVGLTVTAFVLKAIAVALQRLPQFNSSLDLANNVLIYKKYCHIGVAVDTEAGLIVPVLRDVNKKSILQIAGEMKEIAERTRQRKVALEELKGGVFTVTNLGGIGGTAFTPIINYPEVAILGMARTRQQPRYVDGQLQARLILPLCLSYDHRVINGADGARFIRLLSSLLEDPEMLLLES